MAGLLAFVIRASIMCVITLITFYFIQIGFQFNTAHFFYGPGSWVRIGLLALILSNFKNVPLVWHVSQAFSVVDYFLMQNRHDFLVVSSSTTSPPQIVVHCPQNPSFNLWSRPLTHRSWSAISTCTNPTPPSSATWTSGVHNSWLTSSVPASPNFATTPKLRSYDK